MMEDMAIGMIKEIINGTENNEERIATLRRIGDLFHDSATDIDFGGDGLMEDW